MINENRILENKNSFKEINSKHLYEGRKIISTTYIPILQNNTITCNHHQSYLKTPVSDASLLLYSHV